MCLYVSLSSTTSFIQSRVQFTELLSTFANRFPSQVQKEAEIQFQEMQSSIKQTYEVEVPSPYDVFWNPAPMTIVYTTKLFQPNADSFDESYKFVGPSISKRFTMEPFNFSGIQEEKLIYIELGAGIQLSMDGLTSTQIKEAVSTVFSNESYRLKAVEIGQSFQAGSGHKQAVDEIEKYKSQQGI